jgi:hypothetical protein
MIEQIEIAGLVIEQELYVFIAKRLDQPQLMMTQGIAKEPIHFLFVANEIRRDLVHVQNIRLALKFEHVVFSKAKIITLFGHVPFVPAWPHNVNDLVISGLLVFHQLKKDFILNKYFLDYCRFDKLKRTIVDYIVTPDHKRLIASALVGRHPTWLIVVCKQQVIAIPGHNVHGIYTAYVFGYATGKPFVLLSSIFERAIAGPIACHLMAIAHIAIDHVPTFILAHVHKIECHIGYDEYVEVFDVVHAYFRAFDTVAIDAEQFLLDDRSEKLCICVQLGKTVVFDKLVEHEILAVFGLVECLVAQLNLADYFMHFFSVVD